MTQHATLLDAVAATATLLAMVAAGWKPPWATAGLWRADERLTQLCALMDARRDDPWRLVDCTVARREDERLRESAAGRACDNESDAYRRIRGGAMKIQPEGARRAMEYVSGVLPVIRRQRNPSSSNPTDNTMVIATVVTAIGELGRALAPGNRVACRGKRRWGPAGPGAQRQPRAGVRRLVRALTESVAAGSAHDRTSDAVIDERSGADVLFSYRRRMSRVHAAEDVVPSRVWGRPPA